MFDEVKKEARELLVKFGKDLDKFDVKSKPVKSKGVFRRLEKNGLVCDSDFKTIMFKNAKHKNDVCLLLEKGSW